MPTQRVNVDGITLNLADDGVGPPVLLLHGFPDSLALWRNQVPALVDAGYRVIALDQRGFGEADAPVGKRHYTLDRIVADAVGVLDALGVTQPVRVVGHDWGAIVGWLLAAHHPARIDRLAALSVGHPAAFASGGIAQVLRSWYVVAFQVPGLAERMVRMNDWMFLRRAAGRLDEPQRWIADLTRRGRLTAALNWYRANLTPRRLANVPPVGRPVMGVWSTADAALTEAQMTNSSRHVTGPWRYERLDGVNHWIPLDAPQRLNPLLLDFLA